MISLTSWGKKNPAESMITIVFTPKLLRNLTFFK